MIAMITSKGRSHVFKERFLWLLKMSGRRSVDFLLSGSMTACLMSA